MRVFAIGLVALVGLAPTACASQFEDLEPRAGEASEAEREAPTPRRGKTVGGVPVQRLVEWPATGPDASALTGLSDELRRQIDAAPLPVMVPAQSWLTQPVLSIGDRWYAFAFRRDGMSLNLQASGQARIHEGIRGATPTDRVRDLPGFVTSNEGIVSASWIEHGVAYSLELECASPRAPECTQPRFLLEVAAQLRYVGGEGAR